MHFHYQLVISGIQKSLYSHMLNQITNSRIFSGIILLTTFHPNSLCTSYSRTYNVTVSLLFILHCPFISIVSQFFDIPATFIDFSILTLLLSPKLISPLQIFLHPWGSSTWRLHRLANLFNRLHVKTSFAATVISLLLSYVNAKVR